MAFTLKKVYIIGALINIAAISVLIGKKCFRSRDCVFCQLVEEKSKKFIYEDDDVVVFPSINPRIPHHYLVIPKEHLVNVKFLGPQNKWMVEKLTNTAKQILKQNGCDMSNISLGFHWSPFNSIEHLHLHAICSKSEIDYFHYSYYPSFWWFVSPEYVISHLTKSAHG